MSLDDDFSDVVDELEDNDLLDSISSFFSPYCQQ